MTENKTKITIAIIGLIGILGGAFFANWDKIFSSPTPVAPLPSPSPEPIPPENGGYKYEPPQESPQERHTDEEQAEISQRIEVLRRDLEGHEREQAKAHKEIERLRPFLETDRDAQQAIENQERWLEELEMDRIRVQREFDYLNEQR